MTIKSKRKVINKIRRQQARFIGDTMGKLEHIVTTEILEG